MYSMVILDDEKIVLQGIQKLCQKEDFGFVIKGAFVDSLKALDADKVLYRVKENGRNGCDFY